MQSLLIKLSSSPERKVEDLWKRIRKKYGISQDVPIRYKRIGPPAQIVVNNKNPQRIRLELRKDFPYLHPKDQRIILSHEGFHAAAHLVGLKRHLYNFLLRHRKLDRLLGWAQEVPANWISVKLMRKLRGRKAVRSHIEFLKSLKGYRYLPPLYPELLGFAFGGKRASLLEKLAITAEDEKRMWEEELRRVGIPEHLIPQIGIRYGDYPFGHVGLNPETNLPELRTEPLSDDLIKKIKSSFPNIPIEKLTRIGLTHEATHAKQLLGIFGKLHPLLMRYADWMAKVPRPFRKLVDIPTAIYRGLIETPAFLREAKLLSELGYPELVKQTTLQTIKNMNRWLAQQGLITFYAAPGTATYLQLKYDLLPNLGRKLSQLKQKILPQIELPSDIGFGSMG